MSPSTPTTQGRVGREVRVRRKTKTSNVSIAIKRGIRNQIVGRREVERIQEGQGPNQKGKGKAKEKEKEKETAATAKEKNEKKTDESEEAWMVGLAEVLDKAEGDESDVESDFINDLFEDQ